MQKLFFGQSKVSLLITSDEFHNDDAKNKNFDTFKPNSGILDKD